MADFVRFLGALDAQVFQRLKQENKHDLAQLQNIINRGYQYNLK